MEQIPKLQAPLATFFLRIPLSVMFLQQGLMKYNGDMGLEAEMWNLPAAAVGNYAEADADITYELFKRFQHLIDEEDISRIVEMESDLFPCFVDMKFKGVRFDQEKAAQLRADFAAHEEFLLQNLPERLKSLFV